MYASETILNCKNPTGHIDTFGRVIYASETILNCKNPTDHIDTLSFV